MGEKTFVGEKMKNQENKKLIKELIESYKEIKNKEIQIRSITVIKRPKISEKFVSKNDYKELVALYDIIKHEGSIDVAKIENMITANAKKFPFLMKCCESIYDFVNELRCNGPYFIAKEMTRQGKEIEKMQKDIAARNKS